MALNPVIYRRLIKRGYLKEGPYQYKDINPVIRKRLEKQGYLPKEYSLTEAHMPRIPTGEIAFPEPTVREAAAQEVFALGELIAHPRETAERAKEGILAARRGVGELSQRLVTPLVPGGAALRGKTGLEAAAEQMEAVETIGEIAKEPLRKYRHPVREFKKRPITTSLEFAWDASVIFALGGLGFRAGGRALRAGKTIPIITEAGEVATATTRAARAGTTAIKVGERMVELSNLIDPTFPLVRGFERATQRGSVIIGTLLEKKALRGAAKAASKEGLKKAAVFDDAVAGVAKIAEAEKRGWGQIIMDDVVEIIETGGRSKTVTHADIVEEAIKAKQPLTMTYLTKGKDAKVRTITEMRWAKGKNAVSALDSISGERHTFAIRNIQGFEGIQSAPTDMVREIYGKWSAMPEDEQRLWYAINDTAKRSIEEGNPRAAATLWDEVGKKMNMSREEAMDIFIGAKTEAGTKSADRLRELFDLKGKAPEEAAETVAEALKDAGVVDEVAEAMGEDIATATVQATAKGVTPEQQAVMRTLGYTEVQIGNITSKGAQRVIDDNISAERAMITKAGVLRVKKADPSGIETGRAPRPEITPEMPVAEPKPPPGVAEVPEAEGVADVQADPSEIETGRAPRVEPNEITGKVAGEAEKVIDVPDDLHQATTKVFDALSDAPDDILRPYISNRPEIIEALDAIGIKVKHFTKENLDKLPDDVRKMVSTSNAVTWDNKYLAVVEGKKASPETLQHEVMHLVYTNISPGLKSEGISKALTDGEAIVRFIYSEPIPDALKKDVKSLKIILNAYDGVLGVDDPSKVYMRHAHDIGLTDFSRKYGRVAEHLNLPAATRQQRQYATISAYLYKARQKGVDIETAGLADEVIAYLSGVDDNFAKRVLKSIKAEGVPSFDGAEGFDIASITPQAPRVEPEAIVEVKPPEVVEEAVPVTAEAPVDKQIRDLQDELSELDLQPTTPEQIREKKLWGKTQEQVKREKELGGEITKLQKRRATPEYLDASQFQTPLLKQATMLVEEMADSIGAESGGALANQINAAIKDEPLAVKPTIKQILAGEELPDYRITGTTAQERLKNVVGWARTRIGGSYIDNDWYREEFLEEVPPPVKPVVEPEAIVEGKPPDAVEEGAPEVAELPETAIESLADIKAKYAPWYRVSPDDVRRDIEKSIRERIPKATDAQVETITEKFMDDLTVQSADPATAQAEKEETAGAVSNFVKSEEGFARRPTRQDLKRIIDTLKAINRSERVGEYKESTKYLLGHHGITPEIVLNSQGPAGRVFTRELRLIDRRHKGEAGRIAYDVILPIRKDLTDLEWENMVDVLEAKANPFNEKVEAATKKLRTEYDKVADEWIRLKGTIRIYDEYGKPHDIPFRKRENYFQHSYPAEMFKDKEFMDEIVEQLAEEMDVSEVEARKIIEQARMDKTGMRMGNLEMARQTDMPGYRRDAGSVIKYFTNAWKRVELSRSFGPKYQKFDDMIDTIKEDGGDPILMREVFGTYTGNIPMAEGLRKHVVPVARQLKRFQILTKMGRASIANFFEGQNIPMALSWKTNLQGIFDWRTKEGRRQIDITGAVIHDALRHIGTGAEKDWVFSVGAPGFAMIERNLRRVGAASAGRWFKDNEAKLRRAIKKGHKRKEATARRELKRWNFDPDDVLENPLGLPENDKRMREGMNGAADFILKAYGPLDLPPGFMGPYGTAISQFRGWQLMQAKFKMDTAYHSAVEAFGHGNFMPLARWLVAIGVFVTTGEAVNELRSWLFHRERTGLYGGIKGELTKKEIANLIIQDYLAVTSIGQLGIVLEALEYHDPFGAVLGPLAGDISAIERIARKPKTVTKEALKRVPVVGAPVASWLYPYQKKKKEGLKPIGKRRPAVKPLSR